MNTPPDTAFRRGGSGTAPGARTAQVARNARRQERRLGRFAALAAAVTLGAVLLPLGAGLQRAAADDGFVTVGDNPVQLEVQTYDTDQEAWSVRPIPAALAPQDAQALLGQPLRQWFDGYWSAQPGVDGKTPHDDACDKAEQATAQQVNDHTGQSAHDITCSLDSSGQVSARLVGHDLELDYRLPGDSISFSVTTPDVCVIVCVGAPNWTDPRFKVSFDVDLSVHLQIPQQPGPLTVTSALAQTSNASIGGDNISGTVTSVAIDGLDAIIQFFGGTGVFPPAEQAVNERTQDLTPQLAGQLGKLSGALDQARRLGFDGLDAVVDDSQLAFRLTHSILTAPQLIVGDAPQTVPSFTRPGVVAQQAEVRPGGQVTLAGQDFPQPTATTLRLGWAGSGIESRALAYSEVEWGEQGGTLRRDRVARHGYDAGGSFVANHLAANRAYQFRVRDCDTIACSRWSDLQTATTAAGSNAATIYIDSVASANAIGSGTLASDGSFQASATVPSDTSTGRHTLIAVVGDAQAQTAVEVIAQGQALQPVIRVVGGAYGATTFMEGDGFQLRGQGFAPGTVSISIDGGAAGTTLGTATAGGDGSFVVSLKLPNGIYGSHKLVAHESAGGTNLDTSQDIYIQMIPR
jgi:hypothetical protein